MSILLTKGNSFGQYREAPVLVLGYPEGTQNSVLGYSPCGQLYGHQLPSHPPRKVLFAINEREGTAARLKKNGIEMIPIHYGECQKNGGSIHCSILPLVRERN